MVYQQQQKLDRLEAFCESLARRIQSLAEAGNEEMPANERPPLLRHTPRITSRFRGTLLLSKTLLENN